jgi:MFS transporter, PHS family, inorganic phosphate transporter
MLASVFFMQPLGQLASNLVALIVVAVTRSHNNEDSIRSVDIMWRWLIGIGVVPGVIASIFRFAIPETPRYLLDIDNDPIKAEFDATTLFGAEEQHMEIDPDLDRPWDGTTLPKVSSFSSYASGGAGGSVDSGSIAPNTEYTLHPPTFQSHWRVVWDDVVYYFWKEGNWRTLLGTCIAWMLLDFGFYGIQLSNPQFLAKTWGTLNLNGPAPSWETTDNPNESVYTMFFYTSIEAMVILNVGSVVGGLLLIAFAPKINRVHLQKYGFLALAALFIAMGVMFITVHREGPVAIVLYVIGQMFFNFGKFSIFPYIGVYIMYSNASRPQHDHIHAPGRALPNPVPSNMPRPECCIRQTRLHPRRAAHRLLQHWQHIRQREQHKTLRLDPGGVQRRYDSRVHCDAFPDPVRAAGQESRKVELQQRMLELLV